MHMHVSVCNRSIDVPKVETTNRTGGSMNVDAKFSRLAVSHKRSAQHSLDSAFVQVLKGPRCRDGILDANIGSSELLGTYVLPLDRLHLTIWCRRKSQSHDAKVHASSKVEPGERCVI